MPPVSLIKGVATDAKLQQQTQALISTLGLPADAATQSSMVGLLKRIAVASESTTPGSGTGGTTNTTTMESLLTSIGANTDTLEALLTAGNLNTDGIEGLLTSIGANTDTLEALFTAEGLNTDGIETLLGQINTNVDTVESLLTSIKNNQTRGTIPLGYKQLAVAPEASVLLSSASGGIPINSQLAIIRANASVRWRDDGGIPTTTLGMTLSALDELQYDGDLTTMRFISISGPASLDMSFYA